MKIAIYVLTRQGLSLAKRLAADLGGAIHASRRIADEVGVRPFDALPALVSKTFNEYDGHVFVAAAGIVVRCIAPHLKVKDKDPAIVCMDQEGRFAVSLLSGHLGGANDLAIQCARSVGGQPVVTTATDSAGVPSLDMLAVEKGLMIGNLGQVKIVNGALLDKRSVQVYDPNDCLGLAGDLRFVPVGSQGDWEQGEPGVWVSWKTDCPDETALMLHPKVLRLGMGCRRGVPGNEIFEHLKSVFKAEGLAMGSVASLGSIDAKRDEIGLLDVARKLDVDMIFYTKDTLGNVEVPTPSDMVKERMGVSSVAEAAALLSSDGGELIVKKTKTQTVTLAVARSLEC